MADITLDLNICLKKKDAPVVLRKDFDVQRISSFLQEAYSIVGGGQTVSAVEYQPDCLLERTHSGLDPRTALHPTLLPLYRASSPQATAGK